MSWYGRPAVPTYQPPQPRAWNPSELDYIDQYPDAYTSWYSGQAAPTMGSNAVSQRYKDFMDIWLRDRQNEYAGFKLTNPEANLPSFMQNQDPFAAYQQSWALHSAMRPHQPRWLLGR